MNKIKQHIQAIMGNDSHTLQERLFRLIATIGLLGLLLGVIVGFAAGENVFNQIAMLAAFMLLVLIVYITLRSHKIQRGAVLVSVITLCIVLPLNFLTTGDIDGGAPVWFVLGCGYGG